MSNKKKYSIRKVSVGTASVLIGIAAGSLGTAYAHEDTNNVVVSAEVNHNVSEKSLNEPGLEKDRKQIPPTEVAEKPVEQSAHPVCGDCKYEEKMTELPVEFHAMDVVGKPILDKSEKTVVVAKPAEQNVSPGPVVGSSTGDKIVKSILEDKADWKSIDEKEFINYLLADIKVDKNKEREIKEIWLIKVKELLAVNPNNENLQKIKSVIESVLKGKFLVEKENPKEKITEDKKTNKDIEKVTENKKENKESVKNENKKDITKEEKITSDKKDAPKENKKPEKVEDKKELSKEQPVPENKKETPKVTSDKKDASNNKKQETSENNAPVENKVLSATLSGRDVAVSFDKNKIDADNVFVGAINDENLNKAIIEKLGNEYKVIEVFEIHFKKDGKKIDSDDERTVKVSLVKNDNAELEVYHIADNNVLEKVESSYSNGSLQFKINHFSKFTILERIRVGAKDLESRVQIVAPVSAGYTEKNKKQTSSSGNDFKNVEVNKKETEELPKTGLESTKSLGIALLALGSAIAIRRKQKQ